MSYAQADTGVNRGGWYYGANNNAGSRRPVKPGYAVLGLLYAQEPLYGFNCDVPAFVETDLDNYINYIQSDWGDGVYFILEGVPGTRAPITG